MLTIIKKIHNFLVHTNRVDSIANTIIKNLPEDINKILDIGCGDGLISKKLENAKMGLEYDGIDIMERPMCKIKYTSFDGINIPFEKKSFDAVQLIDVLHHTEDIDAVIENAMNYTKKYIIIKDHIYENTLDFQTLKFMDWVGNAPHGVKVIYNFQKEKKWDEMFRKNNLTKYYYNNKIRLYPKFANWIFGRKLHFIAILEIKM
jgi:2-polyprenyl-3-methyl-5-hydroxy-6-metoxy-1,4-benzoquinol methylase